MFRRPAFLLSLLTLGLVLPFAAKPVHIDDTFVLHITQQILRTPFDPFGASIDWFGHLMPIWQATTNPPLVSYWLAPVVAYFGASEIPLHLALIPFYLLFVWGVSSLTRRFLVHPWLPALFLVLSAPFLVSGNLMRDVPAAGLAVAGVAWFVAGIDDDKSRDLMLGGLLLGLSVLAKYSMGVLFPIVGLYALLRHRPKAVLWLGVPALVVGGWCLQTWIVYGRIHPLYLLFERSHDAKIVWEDKLFGGLTILGSALFVQPVIVYLASVTRSWKLLVTMLIAAACVGTWAHWFYAADFDLQFQIWLWLGALLLVGVVRSAIEERWSPEVLFLGGWFLTHLAFSVFFVPFQAVRHLLVALVPLVILLFRWFERDPNRWKTVRVLATVLVIAQGLVALAVNVADDAYAGTYREFAERSEAMLSSRRGRVWFVGHWGWQFYANRAGFRMLNRDGPYPREGDLVIWPARVHVGDVLGANPKLRSRLLLQSEFEYRSRLPIRTMSVDARAGFYAVVRRRIPYRFDTTSSLEVFRIYRVLPERIG